jgi:hypothetical protein
MIKNPPSSKSGMVRSQPKIVESRSFKNYNQQSFIRDLKQVPETLKILMIVSTFGINFFWKLLTLMLRYSRKVK